MEELKGALAAIIAQDASLHKAIKMRGGWVGEIGGAWQDAPKITTRICTEYERQAMVRQAEEEAVAKAKGARIAVIARCILQL
jgi:hypothetical protein